MSCWRVLQLRDQPEAGRVPQLLIKPRFDSDAYAVFLTDLSNIWCEELDLAGIVDRASEEESPIEVSKQDTGQLAILLDNVRNSLASNDEASCRMTRYSPDGVTLHTTIALPEPLDSLKWKFHLRKQSSVTLKDELILPLLVSSHIQHDRINGLIATLAEKDRAITRLVDQYESSNLDLAAAFPSLGSAKSGRRMVKREQAARHVPGLQVFDQELWKRQTAELQDTALSTLDLFQEALSECRPKVPPQLLSGAREQSEGWWTNLSTVLPTPNSSFREKLKAKPEPLPKPAIEDSVTEEEETEDEFEVHAHFKERSAPSQDIRKPPSLPASSPPEVPDEDTTDDDDDDDDLDAPPKSQSQSRTRTKPKPRPKSATSEASPPPRKITSSSPVGPPPTAKPKAKSFRIGGKKKAESPAPTTENEETTPMNREGTTISSKPREASEAATENKPARKGFKIGGKAKVVAGNEEAGPITHSPRKPRESSAATKSPSIDPGASVPTRPKKEPTPVVEEREETAEEKAERKRMELKRKNEEAAKKQALSKKKKRF